MLQAEFGDRLIHFENHLSAEDPLTTKEGTARFAWYGGDGMPDVYIDGSRHTLGGSIECEEVASLYRAQIIDRLNETAGLSPVAITGGFFAGDSMVAMTADFTLVDPATLAALRATLLLYEDSVYYCCGYENVSIWNRVTRRIYDETVDLVSVGETVTISANVPIGADWDLAELHAVAYLQETGDKEIVQGAVLPPLHDYTFVVDHRVRSVPEGSGTATFNALLTNVSSETDTLTVAPGRPFGDWSSDFLVCGDGSPHDAPVEVALAPGAACEVEVRVRTDAAREIGAGSLRVTSASSGRIQEPRMRVFNGSHSVLLVDNDGNHTYELPIVNALEALGYLYDTYDAHGRGGLLPAYPNESDFDVAIWQTGRNTTEVIDADAMNDLMRFMDGGGHLFLTSQFFLNSLNGEPNTFVTDYLGVASWTLDKGYSRLIGVPRDVIGDGLDLPLHFQYPSFRRGDDVVPTPAAATDLVADDGSHAMIRNSGGRASAVFMPEAFDAISETDPDPNNTKVLLRRVLEWLVSRGTAEAADSLLVPGTRIASIRPNPTGQRTEIRFVLSPMDALGPVGLDIVDLTGRHVASLFHGQLTAGPQVRVWNGFRETGPRAGGGVYFVRLVTLGGVRSAKLIRLP